MAFLLSRKLSPDAADKDGVTPTMIAAFYGKDKLLQLLLEHGASTTTTDKRGRTHEQYRTRGERFRANIGKPKRKKKRGSKRTLQRCPSSNLDEVEASNHDEQHELSSDMLVDQDNEAEAEAEAEAATRHVQVEYWCSNRPTRGWLFMPSTCTIHQLKQRLEQRTQIATANQRLFVSRELGSESSAFCAIDEASDLQLLLAPPSIIVQQQQQQQQQQQYPIVNLMVVAKQDVPSQPTTATAVDSPAASADHRDHQEFVESHSIINNLVDRVQGS